MDELKNCLKNYVGTLVKAKAQFKDFKTTWFELVNRLVHLVITWIFGTHIRTFFVMFVDRLHMESHIHICALLLQETQPTTEKIVVSVPSPQVGRTLRFTRDIYSGDRRREPRYCG